LQEQSVRIALECGSRRTSDDGLVQSQDWAFTQQACFKLRAGAAPISHDARLAAGHRMLAAAISSHARKVW
jgi:hypothetical protein